MTITMEERVAALEKKVAKLSEGQDMPKKKDPSKTFGIFANDPGFDETVRLGREYREQQTYEKEIAGS